MNLKVLAPAKINLGLEILNKRPDGYHNVDMIMQSVSLYDALEVSISGDGAISIESNVNIGCETKKNIIYKAIKCFFEFTGIKNPGIFVYINKSIPICAGLAGGSSDAAATIVALNKLFDKELLQEDLMKIGSKVGSDVPFCICGGTVRASGRGDILIPINSKVKYHLVIVKPDVNISTANAYEESEHVKGENTGAIDKISFAISSGDLPLMCSSLFNRFESVVNIKEIDFLKNKLIALGANGALMTGSGSAVFGIFEDYVNAKKCHEIMVKNYKQSFLCEPIENGANIVD